MCADRRHLHADKRKAEFPDHCVEFDPVGKGINRAMTEVPLGEKGFLFRAFMFLYYFYGQRERERQGGTEGGRGRELHGEMRIRTLFWRPGLRTALEISSSTPHSMWSLGAEQLPSSPLKPPVHLCLSHWLHLVLGGRARPGFFLP